MSSSSTIPTETAKRCDARKLQVGDVYSRHSFGKIIELNPFQGSATIQNVNGDKWTIGLSVLELEFTIAKQYDEEDKVSRTALIELIKGYPRTAMTINFNKKVDPKEAAKALENGKGTMSQKDWQALVSANQVGPERTMVGFHNNGYDEHGRLKFQESDKGQRLVDPRTINWAIVNRVRLIVK